MPQTIQPNTHGPKFVILKSQRLYGDMISQQIRLYWKKAEVQVFQKGFDALDSIQASRPDMFITGVRVEDRDGLDHIEPFIEHALPIMVITSRKDTRTFDMLRSLRFDALYDVKEEGIENLNTAIAQGMEGKLYVSPSFVPLLKKPKNITLDSLTDREMVILSRIGDGSDDQRVAELLGISVHTVSTHRKMIMKKLKLHHKGELMVYALQEGFVHIGRDGIAYPGFKRFFKASKGGKLPGTPGTIIPIKDPGTDEDKGGQTKKGAEAPEINPPSEASG